MQLGPGALRDKKAATAKHIDSYAELARNNGSFGNPSPNPYLEFLYQQWLFKFRETKDPVVKVSFSKGFRNDTIELNNKIRLQKKELKNEAIVVAIGKVISAIEHYSCIHNWYTDIELLSAVAETTTHLEKVTPKLPKGLFNKLKSRLLSGLRKRQQKSDNTTALDILGDINDFFIKGVCGLPDFLRDKINFFSKKYTKDSDSELILLKALITSLAKSIKKSNLLKFTITLDKSFNLEVIQWFFNFIPDSCVELHLEGKINKRLSIKDLGPILFSLPPHISTIILSKLIFHHASENEATNVFWQNFVEIPLTHKEAAKRFGHAIVVQHKQANGQDASMIVCEKIIDRTLILPDNGQGKNIINMLNQREGIESRATFSSSFALKNLLRKNGMGGDDNGPLDIIYQYCDRGYVTISLAQRLPLIAAPTDSENSASVSEDSEQKEMKKEQFAASFGAAAVACLSPSEQNSKAASACAAEAPVTILDVASGEVQRLRFGS